MKRSFFFLCLTISLAATAQTEAERKELFNLTNNIALAGFDPVSYFDGKAVKGKPTFKHTHKGVIYFFSSPQRRDIFKSDPEKYEPAYGGWCAYAMGNSGERVEVNPLTFKIIDGRLYLFHNKLSENNLEKWNQDEEQLKAKADKKWGELVEEGSVGK